MSVEPAASSVSEHSETRGTVVRNTLYLSISQAITIPISVAANALAGRYLGSEEFGYIYLAGTFCSFAVLGLEWGQQGALPALVARERAKAGVYLGTSLVWRLAVAVPIACILAVICWALGYDAGVRWALALSFPLYVLNSLGSGFKDTIRGFERTDIPAYAHVAQQVLMLAAIVPALMLGGKLRAFLLANMLVSILAIAYLKRALRPAGVPPLSFQRSAIPALFSLGTPFVFFGLAMALQPNLNAMFLSKLAPPEVVGWYGVSQRLIGLIIFPASALIGALYPTLCRLHLEAPREFLSLSRGALYGVSLLAIPAAIGCGMFPELGVSIFGRGEFSGAAAHLRVMSLFVFLVYFSMPLGTALMAANRQKAWALAQSLCVVVSVASSPILIPWFQQRWGNGGIGTCVSVVFSEALVVACGIALSPKGMFDRGLLKSLALSTLAGAAMGGVAWALKPVSLWLAVPASLLVYAAVAWFSGAVQPTTVDMVKGFIGRKFSRAR